MKQKKHRCVQCKKLYAKRDITFAPDPYKEEICGDDTKVWECRHCRNLSADEI